MKRLVLGALLVAVVVVFGGNYYYGRQVEKQLDKAARLLGSMDGSLEYERVDLDLDGSVNIDNVFLSAPGLEMPLNVERIVLRTGSVMGVHHLAMDVRDSQLPEQLGLSIEGIRMPAGGAYDQLGTGGDASLSVAGCGDRRYFSPADYTEMGYRNPMMDAHLDYRLIGGGELFELTVRSVTEDMHTMSLKMDLSLGAPSRDMMAVSMAMNTAELHAVTVTYEDQGYARRAMEFCQKETGLSREAFLAHHLQAWQNTWKTKGLVPGENVVAAYQQFIQQPEQFAIVAKPREPLGMQKMLGSAPELLMYRLQMSLEVNHEDAGRLDLMVMDEAAEAAWLAEQRDTPEIEPVAEPEPAVVERATAEPEPAVEAAAVQHGVIAVADLRNHLNDLVEVRLANGNRMEGRIRELNNDSLKLQVYQSGGYVILPVEYADIVEAQLK